MHVGKRIALLAVSVVFSGLAFACSDSEKAGLAETCAGGTACEDGLYCAEDGWMEGLCTASCSEDPCPTSLGSNTKCINGSQCSVSCGTDGSCPQGSVCNLKDGYGNRTCSAP